ncbi:tripeptidyl-peptidase 1 [Xylariaceae sp. FL0804]|nr:tripeptidyl-peptidase 1 [Xylariaceae sp. FL0804]
MHFPLLLSFFTLGFSVVDALPQKDTFRDASYALVEHEVASSVPEGWRWVADAAGDEIVSLRIALRQSHRDFLEVAQAVSDPKSPRYGQHLSAVELRSILSDTSSAADEVLSWLDLHTESGRVLSATRDGDYVSFSATVSGVQALLDSKFSRFSHRGAGDRTFLRTQSYSIPRALEESIDFIFPTVHFLQTETGDDNGKDNEGADAALNKPRQHNGDPDCTSGTCPAEVQSLYNINYAAPDATSGSALGIAGFADQWASQADLDDFLARFGLNGTTTTNTTNTTTTTTGRAHTNFTVELVNNGTNPQDVATAGLEAMLDLDYTTAFVDPLPVTYYSVGGRPPTLSADGTRPVAANASDNEPFLALLTHLLAAPSPPQVLSVSWSDTERTVPERYARRACDLFAQLAARGVSTLVATGNGGAVGTARGDCVGPDDGQWRLESTFPATCPWVTAVGATAAYGSVASFSNSGFSNYFGRPAWQDADADAYLALINGTDNDHPGLYNASGRATPDVAVLGDNYIVVSRGGVSSNDGTSASTPVFASMVALLNDLRLRQGKPVLGFLNPILYSDGVKGLFTDVSDGLTTTGCANATYNVGGWATTEGWDAATGLGTPDFAKLREALV